MSTILSSSDEPLMVEATRSGRREAVHVVNVVCCDDDGNVTGHFGDTEILTYFRSAAKPFQLLAALKLRPSLIDECSDEELAIMAASHSGEQGHLQVLEELHRRYGLNESMLNCGKHDPYYAPANWNYGREMREISSIHCNCSGKHTAMLLASQLMGWPLEGYVNADHPMQVENTAVVARYIGRPPDSIEYGVDGCNVPTWWVRLREVATAFARLGSPRWADSELERKAIGRIFDAFHRAPWFAAGTGRFCVDFNLHSDGHWLSKIGGEGIYGVSFRDRGIGIGVKVEDGASRAIPPALLFAMRRWSLISDEQMNRLAAWAEVPRPNSSDVIIGVMRVVSG